MRQDFVSACSSISPLPPAAKLAAASLILPDPHPRNPGGTSTRSCLPAKSRAAAKRLHASTRPSAQCRKNNPPSAIPARSACSRASRRQEFQSPRLHSLLHHYGAFLFCSRGKRSTQARFFMRNPHGRNPMPLRQPQHDLKEPRQHLHVPVPIKMRGFDSNVTHLLNLRIPFALDFLQQNATPSPASAANSPVCPPTRPRSFKRVVTNSRSATGSPSLKFKCTPNSQRAASSAPAPRQTQTPRHWPAGKRSSQCRCACASAIPRLTPSVHPRSSAFTIRFLKSRLSRRSSLYFRTAILSCASTLPYH